jgi:hypothetical protein
LWHQHIVQVKPLLRQSSLSGKHLSFQTHVIWH